MRLKEGNERDRKKKKTRMEWEEKKWSRSRKTRVE